jgi:hypothetical protein
MASGNRADVELLRYSWKHGCDSGNFKVTQLVYELYRMIMPQGAVVKPSDSLSRIMSEGVIKL